MSKGCNTLLRGLAAVVLLAAALTARPAAAAEKNVGVSGDRSDSSALTLYGRDWVEQVRKGAIYIWIFGADDRAGGALGSMGIGSGFIFQPLPEENAAYALTNHHVAGNSAMLQVELWDRSTYRAQLVATEPGIDVSLIKIFDIPADAYEANILGDSDKVQAGDACLAIGAPGSYESLGTNRSDTDIDFGLHETTTIRVVKGIEYDPFDFVGTWSGWQGDQGFQVMTNCPYRLVCQASINGGNSGGPLYNTAGEVIGLNHAGYPAGTPGRQNENYSIPINQAKRFAYNIINNGKHEISWLGLDMMFPPEYLPLGAQGGMGIRAGVMEWYEKHYDPDLLKVYSIRRDSPAERAGFMDEDVIETFDGLRFDNLGLLRRYILEQPIGRQVPVTVTRGRHKVELTAEIGVKRNYDSEFSF